MLTVIKKEHFSPGEMLLGEHMVKYRMLSEVPYVEKPVCPEYQKLSIFVPEEYFCGESVNGYTAETAPIFFPNEIGGYLPSLPWGPGNDERSGKPNVAIKALAQGYVVVCPGARGRGLYAEDGTHLGAAPAAILDLKAAVRFLRYNAAGVPGDMEKIISDGTSAGGGMSALLGCSGNAPDYEEELRKLGAADERDDVFASVCYCPVTNLSHIDKALEWTYRDLYTYVKPERFGMDVRKLPDIPMDKEQCKHHDALAAKFPEYVNSLNLILPDGTALTLDQNGDGSFLDFTLDFFRESVRKECEKGNDLSDCSWAKVNGDSIEVDAASYAAQTKRLKIPVGYDDLSVSSGENELFAEVKGENRHFSEYGYNNRKTAAEMADETAMRLMDPMYYFGSPAVKMAKHWRLRYGTENRGCSPAITLLLGLKAQENGANVDVALPFGVGHVGNNDVPELFAWIDGICK